MKTVINVVLCVCAVALAWICIRSIKDEQSGEEQLKVRKDAVIKRLLDIKKAEEAYKEQHDTLVTYLNEEGERDSLRMGAFAETFDELIDFLKTGKKPNVVKQGQLCEELQRAGWTDKKVADLIYQTERDKSLSKEQAQQKVRETLKAEIRKTETYASMSQTDFDKLIKDNKMDEFRVDTTWTPLIEALYGTPDYPVDSLCYIPNGKIVNGKPEKFQLEAQVYKTGDNVPTNYVMQCYAPYMSFLHTGGKDKSMDNRCINLIRFEVGKGNVAGLQIGSITQWNDNAGNWE